MNSTHLTTNRMAIILSSLFFILATIYSLLVPIFEGPDEKLHYPYVKHLIDHHSLPVAGRDLLVKQAATQGPFYYTVAALATFWIDADNMEELLDYNPHWLSSNFRARNDNLNYIIRSPADTFPYQGAALAVHLSRLISVLFGTLAVACTVLIAGELFPGQIWLALGAGGLVAFNPEFVYVSSNVSNDAAATALVALIIWLALRWGKGSLGVWQVIALELLAGLAILTKLNGIVGLGLAGLTLLLYKPTEISYWRRFALVIAIGLVALAVSSWWFIRNWQLYGDLTATAIHLSLSQEGHLSLREIVAQGGEIERTFWASFGRGQLRVDNWIYEGLRWLRYAALAGLIIYFIRKRHQADWKVIGLLMAWLLVELVLLFSWFSLIGSVSHARLLFPALPAVGILGMLGLGQWLPEDDNWRTWLAVSLTAALLVFVGLSLVVYILPAYTPPPPIQESDIPAELSRLDLTFADGLRLLAADLPDDAVMPGRGLNLDLYWEGIAPLDKNYSLFIRVFAPDGSVIVGRDTYPGSGLLPTKFWPVGKIVRDPYQLVVPFDFEGGPIAAEVRVGLFDFNSETRAGIPAINAVGQEVTPTVGRVKLIPQTWPAANPTIAMPVEFADQMRLAGYDWTCVEICLLTLYWTPVGPPTKAYTVFIQHWLAEEQIEGFDSPPREGTYPTNWWVAGEVIVDVHTLPLLTEGSLLVGLYDLETGARLPIVTTEAAQRDNGLIIEVP